MIAEVSDRICVRALIIVGIRVAGQIGIICVVRFVSGIIVEGEVIVDQRFAVFACNKGCGIRFVGFLQGIDVCIVELFRIRFEASVEQAVKGIGCQAFVIDDIEQDEGVCSILCLRSRRCR